MCTEKKSPESLRWSSSVFFSTVFFFLLLVPSTNCFPRLEHFPRDSFDIAFTDEVLEASPPPPRSNLYPHLDLLSRVPLARFYYSVNWFSSAHPRLSLAEKPAADKKRKAEVRGGGESPDVDKRERSDETGTGTKGAKKAVASLYFSHEFNFQAVFA